MLLETKIDHCPSRHQPIIFIKECDNCDRWSVEAPAVCRVQVLARHQAGYLCAGCAGRGHCGHPCQIDDLFVTAASLQRGWSLGWIMSLLTFLPPLSRQESSSILTSWYTEDYTSEKMPRSLLMLSHFQHLLNVSVVDLCYGGWHLNQTSCLHNKIGMIVPKTFIGSYKCTLICRIFSSHYRYPIWGTLLSSYAGQFCPSGRADYWENAVCLFVKCFYIIW